MKHVLIVPVVLALLVGSTFMSGCTQQSTNVTQPSSELQATLAPTSDSLDQNPSTTTMPASSPLDATYEIDGQSVTLENGSATEPIPNSSASVETMIWGQPQYGSLTATTTKDAGVVITQETGGSGTFFYVAASLQVPGGYQGTNAIFIGDRISPQTLDIQDKKIVFNYAIKNPEDNSSTGVSKYFKVEGSTLVEVDSNGAPL